MVGGGEGGFSSYPFQVNSTVWLVMYNLTKKIFDKYMNYSTLYNIYLFINILSYMAHTMKNYSSLQKRRWSVDGFLRCS